MNTKAKLQTLQFQTPISNAMILEAAPVGDLQDTSFIFYLGPEHIDNFAAELTSIFADTLYGFDLEEASFGEVITENEAYQLIKKDVKAA